MTKRYVAVSWSDAVRLASLDGTPIHKIVQQANVELCHRTDWWAWWSDEQLTTAIGLPEELQPEGLSMDAIALIDQVWMGQAITPKCGWSLLASIEKITAYEKVQRVREGNSFRCYDKLTSQLPGGKVCVLHRYEALSNGIYQCDIEADIFS